jgi:hypothetical protein
MKLPFKQPFIGVDDFTDFAQALDMLKTLKQHKSAGSKYVLHVGVMMSWKTLNGEKSKFDGVFPPKESIADIFGSDETYNCIHYIDYQGRPNLPDQLAKVIHYGGMGIHSVQLDMIWPEPADVAHGLHMSRRAVEVILQIGANAFDDINHDPAELIARLQQYDGTITRVLLDRSMGRGVPMDPETLEPYIHAIREKLPDMGIVVAGGLGPDTMHLVEPLVRSYPGISIDAQGKLRQSGDCLDPVDWDIAGRYLTKAIQLMDKYAQQ